MPVTLSSDRMETPLALAFLAARPDDGGAGDPAALEGVLRAACATAERSWPGITVDRGELCRHLAARAGSTAITEDAAAEVALALACARAEPAALAAFDRAYLAGV